MPTPMPRSIAAFTAAILVAACGASASHSSGTVTPQGAPMSPAAVAAADSGREPFNAADVAFMSGMIGHHAQAVLMAGWAPSHGASESVQALCARIVVGQRDEIAFMQRWLQERGKTVPDADPSHGAMVPGMDMPMLMPGMLTPPELARLDSARGPDFDRLFLADMIRHHQGALQMVDQLFNAPGALEDDVIFKYASDVSADQTTEIDRMGRMLTAMRAAQ